MCSHASGPLRGAASRQVILPPDVGGLLVTTVGTDGSHGRVDELAAHLTSDFLEGHVVEVHASHLAHPASTGTLSAGTK